MASYIGGLTAWKRQPDARSGVTSDRKAFYEVTYKGAKGIQLNAFRQQWNKGDNCLEPGFNHLTLVLEPEIIEGRSMGWANLRFEGPESSTGDSDSSDRISYEWERREIVIMAATTTNKGTYAYDAPIVRRSYTQDSKRGSPKSFPSMEDPVPTTLVSFDKADSPLSVADLIVSHNKTARWAVENVSQFLMIENNGGTWTHEEYHTKEISGLYPGAQ